MFAPICFQPLGNVTFHNSQGSSATRTISHVPCWNEGSKLDMRNQKMMFVFEKMPGGCFVMHVP